MEVLYDAWLVALSVCVAVLASWTALSLTSRIAGAAHRWAARLWLCGGAVSMGCGIWSMHFVGMLAASLPIRMAYDARLTALSLLIAVVVSGFALALVGGQALSRRKLAWGGVVMGAGICAMHYVGMAAMEVAPGITYDPWLFAGSLLIAVGASSVALWLAFRLRSADAAASPWKKAGGGVIMGLAIVGMHYTGMAAAQFAPGTVCTAPAGGTDALWLAEAVGALSLLLLLVTLLISLLDARAAARIAQQARRLEEVNERLRRESAELGRANRLLQQEIQARRQAEAEVHRLNQELEVLVRQRTVQLETANRELEAFSYSIAHDLRAPLTAIDGFQKLLIEGEAQPMEGRRSHYHERVRWCVAQMSGLIDALLSLAQMSRACVNRAPVDLGELATQRLRALAEAEPQRRVDWRVEPGLLADADPRLLRGSWTTS